MQFISISIISKAANVFAARLVRHRPTACDLTVWLLALYIGDNMFLCVSFCYMKQCIPEAAIFCGDERKSEKTRTSVQGSLQGITISTLSCLHCMFLLFYSLLFFQVQFPLIFPVNTLFHFYVSNLTLWGASLAQALKLRYFFVPVFLRPPFGQEAVLFVRDVPVSHIW